MDGGAWWASVHGVAKSRTRLSDFIFTFTFKVSSSSSGTDVCEKRHVLAAAAKSLQSCSALCDPMDSSPPGSPDHGILQARTHIEWSLSEYS